VPRSGRGGADLFPGLILPGSRRGREKELGMPFLPRRPFPPRRSSKKGGSSPGKNATTFGLVFGQPRLSPEGKKGKEAHWR